MNKVDHIGIAVTSIEDSLAFYTEHLGLRLLALEDVPAASVRVAFLDANNVKIELLEPLGKKGPVADFLDKRGEGIHHIAFEVESVEKRLALFKEKGLRLADEKPKRGAGGTNVAFLHPKAAHGVLYELCEKETGSELNAGDGRQDEGAI